MMSFEQWCAEIEIEPTHSGYKRLHETWDAALIAAEKLCVETRDETKRVIVASLDYCEGREMGAKVCENRINALRKLSSNAALTGAEGVRVEGTVMRKEEEC